MSFDNKILISYTCSIKISYLLYINILRHLYLFHFCFVLIRRMSSFFSDDDCSYDNRPIFDKCTISKSEIEYKIYKLFTEFLKSCQKRLMESADCQSLEFTYAELSNEIQIQLKEYPYEALYAFEMAATNSCFATSQTGLEIVI